MPCTSSWLPYKVSFNPLLLFSTAVREDSFTPPEAVEGRWQQCRWLGQRRPSHDGHSSLNKSPEVQVLIQPQLTEPLGSGKLEQNILRKKKFRNIQYFLHLIGWEILQAKIFLVVWKTSSHLAVEMPSGWLRKVKKTSLKNALSPSWRTIVISVRESRKNEVGSCGLYFMLKIRGVKETLTEGKRGKEGR